LLPGTNAGMRFFRGLRPEEATYTIEQLLALRPTRDVVTEDAAVFDGRAPLVLQALPAEEAAASSAARERQAQKEARKEAAKARPPKVIGPITECVPVDAQVLQAKRGELRRIEQRTGVQIREKAGLRNYTIMITGTTSIVEAALIQVEEAIADKSPDAQQPEKLPPPVLEPPMEPPPPRPAGRGTSIDDADIAALSPADDVQLSDHTRNQQVVDSSPPDEDWEIPAHWQRPTARSDPASDEAGGRRGNQNWSESNAGWAEASWNEWQEGSSKWDQVQWWNDGGGWSAAAERGASAGSWLQGEANEGDLHTTSGAAAEIPHVQEEVSLGGVDSLAAEMLEEEPLAAIPGRWRQNRLGGPEPPKPATPPELLEGSQSSDANDEDYVDLGQEACESLQAPPPQDRAKPPPPIVAKPAPPTIASETAGPPGGVDEPAPKKDTVTKPPPPVVAKPAPPVVASEMSQGAVNEQSPKKDKAGTPKEKKKLAMVAKQPPAEMTIPPTKPPPPEIKAAPVATPVDVGPQGEMGNDTMPAQAATPLKEKNKGVDKKNNKKNNAVAKPPPAAVSKPAPSVEPKPPPVVKPAPPVIPTPSAWETMGPPIARPPPPPSPLDAPGEPGKSPVTPTKVKAPPPEPKLAPLQDEAEVVLPMKLKAQEAKQKASAKPKLGVKAKSAPKGANPLPQRSAAAAQASKPAPVTLSGGLAAVSGDSRSSASSTKWLERPVERLSETNVYYEEEDDPELASYLWDRKSQTPKNDQTRVSPKAAMAPPPVLPKPAPVPDEVIPPPMHQVLGVKAAAQAAPARPKLGVKAKQPQAKGANPLPQRSAAAAQASKPAPLMVSGGLSAVSGDSRNAASSQKWLERPVEKLSSTSAYYEEEDDPDLAAYLWDRKAQRPKNDQMRVVPKKAAAAASQRLPAPSQQRQRALLTQVMEMGVDEASAKRALTATGWNSVEEALAAMYGN